MEYNVDFSIYDKQIIERAIMDYSEVAEIKISDQNIVIAGEFTEEENNHIFNEFMNYVLSIIN
jgi:hypothetical protein